jgi:methylthioribose-1-phosphate isomerase
LGTAITALTRLHAEGRRLRVFVTETRPYMDGARLAAWELRQAGIGHQVVTDGAVAWLFEREAIDAVLIGAEWIAANGDTGAVVGSRAIAQLAAAAATQPGREGPKVIVSGVSDTIDGATAEGSAIPTDLRSVRDLVAYLDEVPVGAAEALVPATDVIPAGTISALVTERGVLAPPAAASIAALLGLVAGEPG